MEKPDYAFWNNQSEYTLEEASALCCDLPPRRYKVDEGEPTRKIDAMERRLLEEVTFRDTSRTEIRENYSMDQYEHVIPGKRYFARAALQEWSERTGQREQMPFLFPEDRETSPKITSETSLRADTREALNTLIGLLAYALVDKGGNELGSREHPNQSGIIRALRKEATTLGAVLHGLSDSQLQDRLREAFAEIANRKSSGL